MSLSMTEAEREEFLADLHVGVLGVNHGDVPLAVPIWYGYEPGRRLVIAASSPRGGNRRGRTDLNPAGKPLVNRVQ